MSYNETGTAKTIDGRVIVSIITVCFNSATTISDTIESVINQSYSNIEYIIIDGGSTDGTIGIIKSFENHISKWISEPDEGIYDALNKGITIASGDIIGILNSDDSYKQDTVQLVVSEFMKQRDIDVFHGDNEIYDINEKNSFILKPNNDYDNFLHEMIVNHPGSFITRKAYQKYGIYKCCYKLAADYELMLRMYLNKAKFHYINSVLAVMRTGGIGQRLGYLNFKESRDISIGYGYPSILAYKDYYFRSCKIFIRGILVKMNLQSLIMLKRKISMRTEIK